MLNSVCILQTVPKAIYLSCWFRWNNRKSDFDDNDAEYTFDLFLHDSLRSCLSTTSTTISTYATATTTTNIAIPNNKNGFANRRVARYISITSKDLQTGEMERRLVFGSPLMPLRHLYDRPLYLPWIPLPQALICRQVQPRLPQNTHTAQSPSPRFVPPIYFVIASRGLGKKIFRQLNHHHHQRHPYPKKMFPTEYIIDFVGIVCFLILLLVLPRFFVVERA
jgi:hypothetical protein